MANKLSTITKAVVRNSGRIPHFWGWKGRSGVCEYLVSESLEYIVPSYTSDLCLINTDSALDISNEYYKYIKIWT